MQKQYLVKRMQRAFFALMLAALLAGLIPPPLVTSVADLTGFENLSDLEDALPEPVTALAAPGDNLALGGIASQIDTGFGGVASRANDGNTDGNYNNGSVTHTATTNQPWWQVDLGDSYYIGNIVVWNRTDGGAQPAIDNSYILVSDTPFTSNAVATSRTEAKFEAQLTSANRPNPSTSVTVNQFGRYVRVHSPDNGDFMSLAEVQVIEGIIPFGPGEIVGAVYKDVDYNGSRGMSEPGVAGVVVTAITANATLTTTTDVSGAYAFSGLTGPTRVEFTLPTDGSLSAFEPTVAGNTAVQFVDATNGVGDVDFGINRPFDYCQENPTVCTAVQRNGNHNGDTSYAIASVDYNHSTSIGTVAQQQAVGSVWGLAYKAETEQLFASAFVKRHVGLGPAGLGGIYAITDPAGTPAVAWSLDLAAAPFNIDFGPLPDNTTRGLPAGVTSPSSDPQAWDAVGKQGIGDIDLTEDGTELWVVNLYTPSPTSTAGSLIRIDVPNATAPTSAQQFPLAGIGGLPTCSGGILRPWALKFRFGQGYLGVVCTAEDSGDRADMHAYVLSFSPANPTAGMTVEVDIDLTYTKGPAWNNGAGGAAGETGSVHSSRWYPWESTYSRAAFNVSNQDVRLLGSHPTPILTDIDFDYKDDMILGFVDRSGHQFGAANSSPIDADFLDYVSGGDLLRACIDAAGDWQLENAGTCGGVTGGGLNGQGPGGGEFYNGDNFTTAHEETSHGGIAQHPNQDLLVLSAMDPTAYGSGGLIWLDNQDGSNDGGLNFYSGGNNSTGYFSKSIGMGDVEILCDLAPIEVGNRVWEDANGDGVQDPDEAPISGVVVTLHDAGGTQLATATTNAAGEYFFSSAPSGPQSGAHVAYNVSGLTSNTQGYEIRIANAEGGSQQTPLHNRSVTTANVDIDQRDSDAELVGTTAKITFDTGRPGANNHSYDFGFTSAVPVSIGDYIWKDLNNNGLQDDGAPIEGVTVTLHESNGDPVLCTRQLSTIETYRDEVTGNVLNGSDGSLDWTTSWVRTSLPTDGEGTFASAIYIRATGAIMRAVDLSNFASDVTLSFDHRSNAVTAGMVHEVQYSPTGAAPWTVLGSLPSTSTTFAPISFTIPAASLTATAAIRFVGVGTYTGVNHLYIDNIELSGNPFGIAPVSAVTDAAGFYRFDDQDCVAADTDYQIRIAKNQAPLTGLFLTTQNAGGVTTNDPTGDNNDSDASDGGSYAQINARSPQSGQNMGYDFGYVPLEIGNYVWRDNNNNGLQDGGDAPIEGAMVTLHDSSGAPIVCALGDHGTPANYRDEVTGNVLNGSDGSLTWTTSWVRESLPADNEGTFQNALYIRGNGAISRAVDLSIFGTDVTFSFSHRSSAVTAGMVHEVQYSPTGAAPWTPLDVLTSTSTVATVVTYTIPATDATASAAIRFAEIGAYAGTQHMAVDDINVSGKLPTPVTDITASSGFYYFTGADCVEPNTQYEIRIDESQTVLDNLFLVPNNVGGVTTNDPSGDDTDSDAVSTTIGDTTYAVIAATSPGTGVNYSYDFGFEPPLPATINVVKQVVGAASAATFQVNLAGRNPFETHTVSVTLSAGQVVPLSVPYGTYTFQEEAPLPPPPAGYQWESPIYEPADGILSLAPNETATVTVTNTLVPIPVNAASGLIITKTVDWNGATANPAQLFDITVSDSSGIVTNTQLSDGTVSVLSLPAGTYTVTETSPGSGWLVTYTVGSTTSSINGATTIAPGPTIAPVTPGTISGNVYNDTAVNGSYDAANDGPIEGMIITTYGPNNAACGSTTSNSAGSYSILPTCDGPWRVEFTRPTDGSLDYLEPTVAADTSVRFVSTSSATLNVGFHQPSAYCQNTPGLFTSCFIGFDNLNGPFVDEAVGVAVPYGTNSTAPPKSMMVPASEMGSTWGVAWQASSGKLFTASYIKANTGLGPNANGTGTTTGGIYEVSAATGSAATASVFIDLDALSSIDTGVDPHPAPTDTCIAFGGTTLNNDNCWLHDIGTYKTVGKRGLGDIDFNSDETMLYAVNLNGNGSLIMLPVGVPATAPAESDIEVFATPRRDCANPADARPFALAEHTYPNKMYLGVTCTAQSSQDASELAAHIYEFDRGTGPGSETWSLVFSTTLNYTRARSVGNFGVCNATICPATWRPWLDEDSQMNAYQNSTAPFVKIVAHPQPMLTDIEFHQGDLVLGIRNRDADQYGIRSGNPDDASDSVARSAFGVGDLLRACADGAGGWVMESNGSCGGATGGGANNTDGFGTPPNNGEYYLDQFNTHSELQFGGLAQVPAKDTIGVTSMDSTALDEGTISIWNHNTGQRTSSARLYLTGSLSFPNNGLYGKANGLGDLEAMCIAAPTQIGNRVWDDYDGNGVQDAGEPGINGLTVTLQTANGISTTTTTTDGNYLFTVEPFKPYTITVATPSGYILTTPNMDAADGLSFTNNDPIYDVRDSDATLVGGTPTIYYTTAGAGQNNHGLDFGFVQPASGQVDILNTAPAVAANPSLAVDKQLNGVNPFGVGENISFSIRITNTGDVAITKLPLEDRFSSAFITFISANPAPDGVSSGILTWNNLLAGDPDGLAVDEAMTVDVTFTTAADTTLLPALANCSPAGHTPNLAHVVNALAGGAPVVTDGDDEACASVQILNPTAVQLAERSLTQTPEGVLVRWQMVEESNVVGFYLWRSNGVESARRSELIPTRVNGQAANAAAYEWLDAGATLTRGDAYVLEIVKVDGTSERVIIDVMRGGSLYLPLITR